MTPTLKRLVYTGLKIRNLVRGHTELIDENRETIGTMIVSSYITGTVNYRFGDVYFALVKTKRDWKVGFAFPPQGNKYTVHWNKDATMEFLSVETVDLPLIDALRTLNTYIVQSDDYYITKVMQFSGSKSLIDVIKFKPLLC